jgi:hypothetical protein
MSFLLCPPTALEMTYERDPTGDTEIGLSNRNISLRKKIGFDYQTANDGLDIRALRDEKASTMSHAH